MLLAAVTPARRPTAARRRCCPLHLVDAGRRGQRSQKGHEARALREDGREAVAEQLRKAAKDAFEAEKRRRLAAAEQAKAADKQMRRRVGVERVSDRLRVQGAAASSSAAASAAAAPDPEAAPEPKGSIIGFLKPKAEP